MNKDLYKKIIKFLYGLPIVWGFFLVIRYGVNVHFYDEWEFLHILTAVQKGTYTLKDLFTQHNEHRMVFPKILIIILGFLSKDNSKIFMLASMCIASISYILCIQYLKNACLCSKGWNIVYTLLTGGLLFHAVQIENILWGFQTAWFIIVLCAIICFVQFDGLVNIYDKYKLIVLIIFGCISSFSSLHGIFIWLVFDFLMILLLIKRKVLHKSIYISIILFQILCFCFYFYSYHKPDYHPRYLQSGRYIAFKYYCTSLGAVFSNKTRVALRIGVVLFLVSVFFILFGLFRRKFLFKCIFPLGLICYGNLFALSVAIGRSGFGINQAMSSRYSTNTILVPLGILICSSYFLSYKDKILKVVSICILICSGVLCCENLSYLGQYRTMRMSRLDDAWLLLNYRDEDSLFRLRERPTLQVISAEDMKILEQNEWNVFSKSSRRIFYEGEYRQ